MEEIETAVVPVAPVSPLDALDLGNLSPDQQQTVVSLLSMIHGLQYEVLSGDMWSLAMYRAADTAERFGVPREVFVEVYEKLDRFRGPQLRRNPLSAMF